MKCVILAGGLGTRLAEETSVRPKPMVEIGGKPILWHIMKIYSMHGVNEFIICLGYKGNIIKEYFANYFLYNSDVTFDMTRTGAIDIHCHKTEPWKVTLVDTGEDSQTGGRLKRIKKYVENEPFCFTYGDGVSNVDITQLIEFHRREGRQATVTAVQPPGRFGAVQIQDKIIASFQEKPAGDGGWINGGFYVLEPTVFDLIDGDHISWESDVLDGVAKRGELGAYKHNGFWRAMDHLRDKTYLNELWDSGQAPWKIWS